MRRGPGAKPPGGSPPKAIPGKIATAAPAVAASRANCTMLAALAATAPTVGFI